MTQICFRQISLYGKGAHQVWKHLVFALPPWQPRWGGGFFQDLIVQNPLSCFNPLLTRDFHPGNPASHWGESEAAGQQGVPTLPPNTLPGAESEVLQRVGGGLKAC